MDDNIHHSPLQRTCVRVPLPRPVKQREVTCTSIPRGQRHLLRGVFRGSRRTREAARDKLPRCSSAGPVTVAMVDGSEWSKLFLPSGPSLSGNKSQILPMWISSLVPSILWVTFQCT